MLSPLHLLDSALKCSFVLELMPRLVSFKELVLVTSC